ncbi:hypothetical protein EVAR_7714_1 [Eumeta japonica]|uniref:Uncharacterized protein n=1 Tax=Eumeta variegata TaxID=151549 RepID=A0A4C1TLN7_EUMVA|nr:hypothetical protein EVAR_7714_1 [Eumeta japonica]
MGDRAREQRAGTGPNGSIFVPLHSVIIRVYGVELCGARVMPFCLLSGLPPTRDVKHAVRIAVYILPRQRGRTGTAAHAPVKRPAVVDGTT